MVLIFIYLISSIKFLLQKCLNSDLFRQQKSYNKLCSKNRKTQPVVVNSKRMLCPYCNNEETKVIDKRDTGGVTKRRRQCLKCEKRFNTLEMIEKIKIRVIKKDGRREDFDREKVRKGLTKACEKRPVSTETIEKMVTNIEERLRRQGKDVQTHAIGELVSKELKKVDKVAYIRFASVYREFADVADFKKEIKELNKNGR